MSILYDTVQQWFDSDVYVDFEAEKTPDGLIWIAYDIGNPADHTEICRGKTFIECVKKAYFIRSTGGPKLRFDRRII